MDDGSLISEYVVPELENGDTESHRQRNGPEPGNDDKESYYPSRDDESLEQEKYPTRAVAGQGTKGAELVIPASELVSPIAVPSQNCTDEWPAEFANGKTDIRFDSGDVWSFSNQIKGRIEDYIGAPVDWWPLSPREKALPDGFTRVRWTCVSRDP